MNRVMTQAQKQLELFYPERGLSGVLLLIL